MSWPSALAAGRKPVTARSTARGARGSARGTGGGLGYSERGEARRTPLGRPSVLSGRSTAAGRAPAGRDAAAARGGGGDSGSNRHELAVAAWRQSLPPGIWCTEVRACRNHGLDHHHLECARLEQKALIRASVIASRKWKLSQQEVVRRALPGPPCLSVCDRVLRSRSAAPSCMLRAISTAAPSARGPRPLARACPLARSARQARASPTSTSGGGLTAADAGQVAVCSEASVEMVILPGSDGMFGVMPSHVQTIRAQARRLPSRERGGELSVLHLGGPAWVRAHEPRGSRVGRRVGTASVGPCRRRRSPMRLALPGAAPTLTLLRPGAPCPHAQSTRTPCSTSVLEAVTIDSSTRAVKVGLRGSAAYAAATEDRQSEAEIGVEVCQAMCGRGP